MPSISSWNMNTSLSRSFGKLAERAGIALPEKCPQEKQFYDERRKLIAINKSAMGYFCDMLSRSPMALEYLDRREFLRKCGKICPRLCHGLLGRLKTALKKKRVFLGRIW